MNQIVLVIDGFKPGGAQQVYLLLIEEYLKKFSSVALIIINSKINDLTLPVAHNFKSYNLQAKKIFRFGTFFRYWKIINQLNPDYILASLYGSQILSAFFRPKSSALIWIEQNTYINRTALHWLIMRLLKARVSKIICVSREVLEVTNKYLGGNTVQLPNPINFPASTKVQIRNNDFVFVGRMVEQKNPWLAIDSFKVFLEKFSVDTRFHIVGDGELLADVINYSEQLGISQFCIFHKSLKLNDTMSVLSTSKVFMSTSRIEGFGLARLEALASGCCIITTDTGGINEYSSLNPEIGLFLAEPNPNNIANCMADALKDFLWTPEIIGMRVSQTSRFDAKIVSEQWLTHTA